jgi:hypothetical protein
MSEKRAFIYPYIWQTTTVSTDYVIITTDHDRSTTDHGIIATDHGITARDHGITATDHGISRTDHVIDTTDDDRSTTDHGITVTDHGIRRTDHVIDTRGKVRNPGILESCGILGNSRESYGILGIRIPYFSPCILRNNFHKKMLNFIDE